MSSVRTEKEATTTLSEALKPAKTREADGDAVVRALKSVTEDSAPAGETIDGFHLVIDALKLAEKTLAICCGNLRRPNSPERNGRNASISD